MTNTLIIAAMLTAIILPIIILGIQDARRHSWRPTNKHKDLTDASGKVFRRKFPNRTR